MLAAALLHADGSRAAQLAAIFAPTAMYGERPRLARSAGLLAGAPLRDHPEERPLTTPSQNLRGLEALPKI
jgi:hypothetical protein